MTLTIEQLAYWQGYIDTMKPLLRLQDWNVTLTNDSPSGDDATAAIWTSNDYHTAKMYLCGTWEALASDEQRESIVHEFVHIHLCRLSMFTHKVSAQLGGQAQGLADEMHEHFLEAATDELARVIAPFLPLPPAIEPESEAAA